MIGLLVHLHERSLTLRHTEVETRIRLRWAEALDVEAMPEIVVDQEPRGVSEQRAPQRHSPLLKGVDHFFATSSEPEVLFKFFRDTLGLPQVWDFKNFGDFAPVTVCPAWRVDVADRSEGGRRASVPETGPL